MADSYGYTRIRQLPESAQLQDEDYLVMENDTDTWKVKVSTFYAYINSILENFKDIVDSGVDDKITVIQQLINSNTEINNQINNMIEQYKNDENDRKAAEENRQNQEIIRENTYIQMQQTIDEWTDEEAIRKANEIKRKDNEIDRINNEDERKLNESARIDSENTRKNNETTRGINESTRMSNEDIRKDNEVIRINNYNDMTAYYEAVKESFNNYGKDGTSNATTPTNKILSILTISIPNGSNNYIGLFNMSSSAEDIDIFFALKIQISSNSITPYIAIPKRYKNINISDFNINYDINSTTGQIIINIEYIAKQSNTIVRTAIVWDNISIFKSNTVPIYSLANRNEIAKSAISTHNIATLNSMPNTEKNYPYTFIKLLNSDTDKFNELSQLSIPFNSYPIGTIYQTTSDKNPNEILGGGTWKQLYGAGISEGVIINNTAQYSPTIYYWERIA